MSAQPAPAPQPSAEDLALGLFARASLDLFDVWPALRLAISHGWGGNGTQGKTALAEDVVDLFYTVATSGGAAATTPSTAGPSTSTSTQEGGVPVPAQDEVEQTLLYVIGNEFDVDLEDGSEAAIARDLIKLWRECIQRVQAQLANGASTTTSEEGPLARDFRERAERARAQDGQQRFAAQRQGGQGGDDEDDETTSEEDDDDDESDEDDEMEGVIDEPVPQLVETQRPEPVVDEDGFELVQPKKKGGRK